MLGLYWARDRAVANKIETEVLIQINGPVQTQGTLDLVLSRNNDLYEIIDYKRLSKWDMYRQHSHSPKAVQPHFYRWLLAKDRNVKPESIDFKYRLWINAAKKPIEINIPYEPGRIEAELQRGLNNILAYDGQNGTSNHALTITSYVSSTNCVGLA